MQKIKCAVVGVGYLGNFHAQKYSQLSNAELIAVCDTDEKRGEKIANEYNVDFTSNIDDLLGKVNAVSIATSTPSHYAIAKKFLQNKIHVLLEKPITTSVIEADELIKIAKENNVVLQVGHIERFNPVFKTIKSKIQNPIAIECRRLAPYKTRGNDVSVVLDFMIHDIDLVQNLISAKIKKIIARGKTLLSQTLDVVHAEIEFENNCLAFLSASRVDPKVERKINLLGKNSYFNGDLGEKTLNIINANDLKEEFAFEKNDALLEEIRSFIDTIDNGRQPEVSGTDGKNALETALLIEATCY